MHLSVERIKNMEREMSGKWEYIGKLAEEKFHDTAYKKNGVFAFKLDNKLMYIGRAGETGRGLNKRLNDFVRCSDSARNYTAGELIYKNRNELDTYVMVLDTEDVEQLAKELIRKNNPLWNKRNKDSSKG